MESNSAITAATSFNQLLDELHSGNEDAAREVHRRFTPRLIALARQQFPAELRRRVDPESVIQSVYRSFFQRERDGRFRLGDWNDLWGLLTVITLRKCLNRERYHRQECRDIARETPPPANTESISGVAWEPADPEPTPLQTAMLREILESLFADLVPRDRRIVEGLLQGSTAEEIRQEVGCSERTVRRVRDRVRLMLAAQELN